MATAVHNDQLWLGHWAGPVSLPALPAVATGRAFILDTCLRRIVMTGESTVARQLVALQPPEELTDTEAYRFLVEVTTGLRSAVPGETNVFGQFKRAWEAFRSVGSQQAVDALAGIVAQAIRDTRAIRHVHLRNIGGASYGTLARRLLQPRDGERILFVGAGDLARSMLPFFRAFELGIWNRSPPGPAFATAGRLFAPDAGAEAASWAHHVIMTTPADATNDACWAAWLDASLAQTILHLGHRRGTGYCGPTHATTYDLDDLFELRRSQDNIRSLQIERARLACHDSARRATLLSRLPTLQSAAG